MTKKPFKDIALVQDMTGKAYVIHNGCRHYVPDIQRLKSYGVSWPEDIVSVPDSLLSATRMSGWLPQLFEDGFLQNTICSSTTMREYMAASLRGIGLEVGAGASPFPVPLDCRVLFGDRIPHSELVEELYPGQTEFDLVRPDLIIDFDDFEGIADNSLDFIIGCHVIEHVLDPIGTLVNAHRKLRQGGQLVLVVPDKERTFDRNRPLTTLQHLILDHQQQSDERDRMHYEEFYRLAIPVAEDELQDYVDLAVKNKTDAHFHVWNYETFGELVTYVDSELAGWSDIWSKRTLPDKKLDIEFYFRLTK